MRVLFIMIILIIVASCGMKPVKRNQPVKRLLNRSEKFYNCLTGLNREGFKQSYIKPMCKMMLEVD